MHLFDVEPYVKKFNDFLVLRDLTYNTIKSYNSMLRSYLSWVTSGAVFNYVPIKGINYEAQRRRSTSFQRPLELFALNESIV